MSRNHVNYIPYTIKSRYEAHERAGAITKEEKVEEEKKKRRDAIVDFYIL